LGPIAKFVSEPERESGMGERAVQYIFYCEQQQQLSRLALIYLPLSRPDVFMSDVNLPC